MAPGRIPREGEMPDRIRSQQPAAVLVSRAVGRAEMRHRSAVVVTSDLPDDPDPEPGPPHHHRVSRSPCRRKRCVEMGGLARVLAITTAQETGMEDAPALGLEARIHPIQLSACRLP